MFTVYDGVGHAFWSDMESVRRGDWSMLHAYEQVTTFLDGFFGVRFWVNLVRSCGMENKHCGEGRGALLTTQVTNLI